MPTQRLMRLAQVDGLQREVAALTGTEVVMAKLQGRKAELQAKVRRGVRVCMCGVCVFVRSVCCVCLACGICAWRVVCARAQWPGEGRWIFVWCSV